MKNRIFYIFMIVLTTFLTGCESEASAPERKNANMTQYNSNVVEAKSDHFQSHATGAKEFIKLWRQGKELRASGEYQESLKVLQYAYEDVAFGRVEQAMALIESAKTSEAMGDYEISASFYEGAAEASMNEDKSEEFMAKAKELRQKAGITTSN